MNKYLLLILKAIAAFIMLQTLYFKFSGAQESIDLFAKLAGKNEAILRITTGILELIASAFLFIPRKNWLGGLLTTGLMSGAVLSHLTKLGIEHNNDGGALFASAIVTLIIGLLVLFINRKELQIIGKKF